jgi:hypothetical protein
MNVMLDLPVKQGFALSVLFVHIETKNINYVDFEINPRIKKYLIDLSNYTQYYFENIARLNSAYSLRIYELLKQYQQKNGDGWMNIELDKLKEALDINPISYSRYNDFKRKVILKAQNELLEKTDICFTFEEKRTGRKITSIKFLISSIKNKNKETEEPKKQIPNNTPQLNQPIQNKQTQEENIKYDDKFKILENFKFSEREINSIIKNHNENDIISNAEYTLNQIKKGGVSSPVAYFRRALKDNYALSSQNQIILTNSIQDTLQKQNKKKIEKIKNLELQKENDESFLLKLEEDLKKTNKQRFNFFIDSNLDIVYDFYNNERELLNNTETNTLKLLQEVEKDDFLDFITKDFTLSKIEFKTKLIKKYPTIQLDLLEFIKINNILFNKELLKVEKKSDGYYKIVH